jgi:hypothetical protein
MATQDQRTTPACNYALEFDGGKGGWLFKVDGGDAEATVITESVGGGARQFKHLGAPKWNDITFDCGASMSKNFYDWIQQSFNMSYTRKGGAIIAADYNYKEITRLTWFNGLIGKCAFPALDAGANDPAKISVTIKPEKTKKTTTVGASIGGSAFPTPGLPAKAWTTHNFRFKMDGLDKASKKVSKVGAVELTQNTAVSQTGEMRDSQIEAVSLSINDLTITIPESVADEAYAWHEDFVINGNCFDDKERGATLEYLTSDLKTTIFTLTFDHCGIYKIKPTAASADDDKLKTVDVTFYVEAVKFDYNTKFLIG